MRISDHTCYGSRQWASVLEPNTYQNFQGVKRFFFFSRVPYSLAKIWQDRWLHIGRELIFFRRFIREKDQITSFILTDDLLGEGNDPQSKGVR